MIITTTPILENKTVKEYLGVVASETILNTHFIREFLSSVVQAMGGRVDPPENRLAEARDTALRALEEKAAALGADAVVGLKIRYVSPNDIFLIIAVSGTAVRVE